MLCVMQIDCHGTMHTCAILDIRTYMPLHLAQLIFCHCRLFVEEKVDDFVLRPKVSAPLATIPSKAAVLQIVIQTAFFLLGKTDGFFPHHVTSGGFESEFLCKTWMEISRGAGSVIGQTPGV